ncbi:acyl carrier protein [compost metagenome]
MNDIEKKVRGILGNVLHITEDLKSYEPLQNHGLSSINFINIIIRIEKDFNVEITDQDLGINKFSTIEAIVTYITNLKSVNA